jgi:hypothetical protein
MFRTANCLAVYVRSGHPFPPAVAQPYSTNRTFRKVFIFLSLPVYGVSYMEMYV